MTNKITLPGGTIVIDEAPQDGVYYGRINASWLPVTEEVLPDDKLYARRMGKWEEIVSSGVYVQDDPPALTVPPDSLWWESDTGDLHILYDDGSSVQWVQIGGGGSTMEEPPADDRGYVRTTHLNGVSQWVPPAFPPLATPDEPGLIEEPVADAKGYVRTTYLDGTSQWVPPALPPVTADEPPPDDKGYVRTTHTNGVSQWVPPALPPLATPDVSGLIEEPVADAKGYVRTTQLDGTSQWVPPAPTMDEPPPDDKGYVRTTHLDGVSQWVPPALPALATPEEPGLIEEPIADDKGYVRTTHLDGTSQWVPPAPSETLIAGNAPKDLGSVYIPARNDHNQGLDLNGDGGLYAPPATHEHLGTLLEPPEENKQYARFRDPTTHNNQWVEVEGGMEEPPMDPVQTWGRSSGGARGWLPIPDSGIEDVPPAPKGQVWGRELGVWRELPPIAPAPRPAGKSQPEIGIVYVPDRLGLAVGPDGQLALTPATPDQIGGLREVPGNGNYVRKTGAWELFTETTINAGIGLEKTGNTIDLQPPKPSPTPELGGVYGTPRSDRNAVVIDAAGHINVPEATDLLLGGILEPPPDEKAYARKRGNAGVSTWVESGSSGIDDVPTTPVEVWGRTPGRWVPINNNPNLPLERHVRVGGDTMTGQLVLYGNPTDFLGAVPLRMLNESKAAIELWTTTYFTQIPPAGGPYWMLDGAWSNIPAGVDATYGIGIDLNGDVVNLQPPKPSPTPEIGGVYGTPRSERNGIVIDSAGHISAPLATADLAGTIIEPVADGKGYVRASQPDGSYQWVPPAPSGGGCTISDTPPLNPANEDLWWESDSGDLFIWYEDPSGPPGQWVQVNGVSPPPGVHVADDPPMSPTPNALWWDSNAGTLNLWYTDVDTSQWVQVAAPQIPGVPEAPIDGVPYSRRDANWVATTSLAATPGDLKDGFQTNDHGGWIKLDGRLVNTLTSTQQAQANLLGFTTNLPDGVGAVALMNGTAMGTVAGSMTKTIAQANLPTVNLTAANVTVTVNNFDFGAVNTNEALNFSDEVGQQGPRGQSSVGGTGYWFIACGDEGGANMTAIRDYKHSHTVDLPTHTHTTAAHGHSVPLGGSGTPLDTTPKSISVNKFVFLGA